jgi:hypothetical protein
MRTGTALSRGLAWPGYATLRYATLRYAEVRYGRDVWYMSMSGREMG